MQTNNSLTPFGRITQERLTVLGKDEEWLLSKLAERRIFITHERYQQLITGEAHSRPNEVSIGKLLSDEENIQRLAKKIGIRRG